MRQFPCCWLELWGQILSRMQRFAQKKFLLFILVQRKERRAYPSCFLIFFYYYYFVRIVGSKRRTFECWSLIDIGDFENFFISSKSGFVCCQPGVQVVERSEPSFVLLERPDCWTCSSKRSKAMDEWYEDFFVFFFSYH